MNGQAINCITKKSFIFDRQVVVVAAADAAERWRSLSLDEIVIKEAADHHDLLFLLLLLPLPLLFSDRVQLLELQTRAESSNEEVCLVVNVGAGAEHRHPLIRSVLPRVCGSSLESFTVSVPRLLIVGEQLLRTGC